MRKMKEATKSVPFVDYLWMPLLFLDSITKLRFVHSVERLKELDSYSVTSMINKETYCRVEGGNTMLAFPTGRLIVL